MCTGIPWAGMELPSKASPAGDRKRHRAWTGTCSTSWRLLPFQASCGGCTATWGISCIIRIILGARIHWYVTCDSLMLATQLYKGVDLVLPLVGCVLSCDSTDSEKPWYLPREKGSGEDRWRWGQVLAHLKLHSFQFLFPGTAKNVLSGYGKHFTQDTVHTCNRVPRLFCRF